MSAENEMMRHTQALQSHETALELVNLFAEYPVEDLKQNAKNFSFWKNYLLEQPATDVTAERVDLNRLEVFLNSVAAIAASFSPTQLMDASKDLEGFIGIIKKVKAEEFNDGEEVTGA